MPESERRQFSMGGVAFVNQLDGPARALKIAQRRHARFINSTMMVTLLGAAVSDGLADGQVVSGVGGQYNFVAMAHSLPEARSILALRSTREKHGKVTSNILWNYAHATIPRHLRDIVVTEYGVADLRGRSDEGVIAALLNIADSRFQDALKREAQAAGKLSRGHAIPDAHRNNTPRALEEKFLLPRARGLFSEFPFGTDLTGEEIVLAKALTRLKDKTARTWPRLQAVAAAALSRGTPAGSVCWCASCACNQRTGNSRDFCTVRSAKLEWTRATFGNRVRCWLCSRSKSAVSANTTRNRKSYSPDMR